MKARIGDIELHYEQRGEGEPIIFAHGWMDDCSVWNAQMESLAENHKAIAYDHRGHGRSDKPKGDYSIQTLADDLHSLIQELNLEEVTLVGHAMGGAAALTLTLDHPDKVSRLVLVGTAAKSPIWTQGLRILRYAVPYRTFAGLATRPKYHKPSQQVIEDALERAMNTPKYAAYECLKELAKNYDIRYSVYGIKVPTLIVVGKNDISMPVRMSRYLHGRIEGSELRIVPDCGHMVMIEKPDELNQILAEFMSRSQLPQE